MSRFVLISPTVRLNAAQAVAMAPDGYVVEIKEPKRSSVANSKMWAMLSDVAKACPEGRQWTPEVWKSAFMHALGHQVMFAEGLNGSGPFPLGFRSSNLTVKQMSDLIETMYAYGSEHGVKWSESEDGGLMDMMERLR